MSSSTISNRPHSHKILRVNCNQEISVFTLIDYDFY